MAPEITINEIPIPIISKAALRYCVECSMRPVDPNTIPPRVHTIPPRPRTPIISGKEGCENHFRKRRIIEIGGSLLLGRSHSFESTSNSTAFCSPKAVRLGVAKDLKTHKTDKRQTVAVISPISVCLLSCLEEAAVLT